GGPRAADHERIQLLHLALQETDRVCGIVGTEGVRADELRETVRLMYRGCDLRPHLEEPHPVSAPGELPGALRARKPGADDRDPRERHRQILFRRGAGGGATAPGSRALSAQRLAPSAQR